MKQTESGGNADMTVNILSIEFEPITHESFNGFKAGHWLHGSFYFNGKAQIEAKMFTMNFWSIRIRVFPYGFIWYPASNS